ncbi:MAG: diguanylate cyclase [Sumerlaeia bacterium]
MMESLPDHLVIPPGSLPDSPMENPAGLLAILLRHLPVAVALFDRRMRYLLVSERWLDDYKLHGQDILGRCHYDVFKEIPRRWMRIHERCLEGHTMRSDADPFPRIDGTTDYIRWEVRPWYLDQERIGGLLFLTEIITGQVEARRLLENYATEMEELTRVLKRTNANLDAERRQFQARARKDFLTLLHNKGYFNEELDKAIELVVERQIPMALLFLDLDHFKEVNDTHGHLVGDNVLKDFGLLLQCLVRGTDLLGRLGGEEFAVALMNTNEDQAAIVAEHIRHTLEKTEFLDNAGNPFHVTCSIGVAVLGIDGLTRDDLLGKADQALYAAKRTGRNRVVRSCEVPRQF